MKRLKIIFCVIVGGVLVMSCSPEAAQDEPIQMPFKENTWVRKEEVKKTRILLLRKLLLLEKIIPIINEKFKNWKSCLSL